MVKNQILYTSLLAMLFLSFELLSTESHGVKMAEDLKLTGENVKSRGIPLLLFFAAEDCGYCERLENDYLRALATVKSSQQQLIIRKVVVDSYDEFLDFSGKIIEASDFSDKFNIQVFPTLVFLDHSGNQISRPIIGYNGSYFFGAELDEGIAEATKNLHQNSSNIIKASNIKI